MEMQKHTEDTSENSEGCEDQLITNPETEVLHERDRHLRRLVQMMIILLVITILIAMCALVMAIWTMKHLNATVNSLEKLDLLPSDKQDAADMVHVASQKQLSDAKEIIMAINETLNSKFEVYNSILDNISLKMEKMKAQADDSMCQIEDQLTKQMMNISKDLELNLFQDEAAIDMLNASLHNQFEEVAVEIESGRGTLADIRAKLISINHTMKLFQDNVLQLEQAIANTSKVALANGAQVEYISGIQPKTCNTSYILNPVSSTCIRLVTTHANWDTAKYNCEQSEGEHLAVFDTLASVDWIYQFRRDPARSVDWTQRLWIGLKYDHGWRWQGRITYLVSTDDPIWAPDEPDDNDDSSCGYLIGIGDEKIYDYRCYTAYAFICEKSL